jgi:non-ribosomal peptide synthetase component F
MMADEDIDVLVWLDRLLDQERAHAARVLARGDDEATYQRLERRCAWIARQIAGIAGLRGTP